MQLKAKASKPTGTTARLPRISYEETKLVQGWASRHVDVDPSRLVSGPFRRPRIGDLAILEVTRIGKHRKINTTTGRRRLYEGSRFIGVFGARYATDAFEAVVGTSSDVHILTSGGVVGTVQSRHADIGRPTELRIVGQLAAENGQVLNAIDARFQPAALPAVSPAPIVLVTGTSMNSGKTTTARHAVHGLASRGLRVAACKWTGSASPGDRSELESSGATFMRDFSDYGFPSTFGVKTSTLHGLLGRLIADATHTKPDLIVLEIADGVLQQETRALLREEAVRRITAGVLLAAPCPMSALYGIEELRRLGHEAIAVSGRLTSAPLAMAEFTDRSDTPLLSSREGADEDALAGALLQSLGMLRR